MKKSSHSHAPVHRAGDNLGTNRPIRRTSCAHPVGAETRRKTSPKPLVPLAETGVELRPRRARRAGHPEATPAAGGMRETAHHLTRPDQRVRPRRERSADQGAGSSEPAPGEEAPRGQSPGDHQRAPAGGRRRSVGRARRPPMRSAGHGSGSSDPRPRCSERETASASEARRTYGSTDARSRGRGNLTAGQADVPRAPRSHTSRGPHQFLWCLLARRTPARHDGMSLAPSRPRLGG